MITPGYALLLIIVFVLAWLYIRASVKPGRYQSIHDDALGPMLRVDLDTFRPVTCNPSFASLLQYSNPAECIELFRQYSHLRGQSFRQLYRSVRETRQKVITIELVNRSDHVVASEAEIFVPNGADFMELRLLPRDASMPPASINVRQSLLPCIETDRSLTVLSCNEAARDLFNWADTRVAGCKLDNLVFPAHVRSRLASVYCRRLDSKGNLRLKHPTLLDRNEIAECRWHVTLQADTDRVYAFCIYGLDGTLVDSLREDILGDTYFPWEVDIQTGQAITDPSWLERLGYEDVAETSHLAFWYDIVFPEDRTFFRQVFQELFDGDEDKLCARFRLTSSTGVEHWIEARAVVKTYARDGKPRRVHGVLRDITDIVHRQEPGNDAQTRHALANHLASITGYANLISESEGLSARLTGYIHEIVDAGKKARELLQGKQSATPVGGGGLIGAVEEIARKHGIGTIHNEPAPQCRMDRTAVDRILEPLCRNALEATADAQAVCLETGRAPPGTIACSTCRARPDNGHGFIRIHDTGQGIEAAHLPWVFRAGFTTRALSSDKGMGLASVDECVHRLGGHIELHSVPEEGTQVTVYLPEILAESPSAVSRDRDHILVVDDDKSVAGYLQAVIGREGYRVTAITDPKGALSAFQREPDRFDLVITDQTMPGLSGDALMQSMLEIRPELPIIICTGYSETIGESAARDLGARGFVRKPIDAPGLLGLIDDSLPHRVTEK